MSAAPETQAMAKPRQRKAHRKSRLGCSNCKLRGVKCDEAKPCCKRCAASNFNCAYSTSAPALQFQHAGVLKLDLGLPLLNAPNPSIHDRIPLALPIAGQHGTYELRHREKASLQLFLSRTASTLGPKGGSPNWYTDGALALSNAYPFLCHVFIALAELHKIHVTGGTTNAFLSFHSYHGTALYHHFISRAVKAPALSITERDTLWVTAAMLGSAAFAYTGPFDPLLSWPLCLETDLTWLKMSHGKKAVWDLADPTTPDSLFVKITRFQVIDPPPNGAAPIPPDALPPLFYKVFELGPDSTPTTNVYHSPASVMAQLLTVEPIPTNIHRFLTFLSQTDGRFHELLCEKDPRAMILLAYWMAKISVFDMWWTRPRTMYQGLAICLYVERYCTYNENLVKLVKWPKGVLESLYTKETGKRLASCT